MHKYLAQALLLAALAPATAYAQPASPFPPITPEQAKSNEGENVVIEGIAKVHAAERRLGWYIDLNGTGVSSPFAGYIPAGNKRQFPNLSRINGKIVDISGVVQFRNSKPIIKMTDAHQLRVVR
jgi:hypothetical protein